jgi:hypothetical protein
VGYVDIDVSMSVAPCCAAGWSSRAVDVELTQQQDITKAAADVAAADVAAATRYALHTMYAGPVTGSAKFAAAACCCLCVVPVSAVEWVAYAHVR